MSDPLTTCEQYEIAVRFRDRFLAESEDPNASPLVREAARSQYEELDVLVKTYEEAQDGR